MDGFIYLVKSTLHFSGSTEKRFLDSTCPSRKVALSDSLCRVKESRSPVEVGAVSSALVWGQMCLLLEMPSDMDQVRESANM